MCDGSPRDDAADDGDAIRQYARHTDGIESRGGAPIPGASGIGGAT